MHSLSLAVLLLALSNVLAVKAAEETVQFVVEQNSATTPTPDAASTPSPSTAAPGEIASTTIVLEGSGSKSTPTPASRAAEVASTTTKMPIATVQQLIRILSSEHADPTEPIHSFCDYMKPICTVLDKLTEKCIAKTGSQLKKFSKLSDGKLNQCFLDTYSFDPTKANLTKADISSICASKNMTAEQKGSYKAFQACATKHWTGDIDKEIDKIQVARLEYLRANQHLKDSTTSMLMQGDEEEAKIVSAVVNKVLGGDSAKPATASEVKVVSVDPPKATGSTTATPSTVTVHHSVSAAPSGSPAPATSAKPHSSGSASPKADKNLLNDPNTLLVFVNENKTTTKPDAQTAASKKAEAVNLVKAIDEATTGTTAAPSTTATPKIKTEITTTSEKNSKVENSTTVITIDEDTTTTAKPATLAGSSSKPALSSSSTAKPDASIAKSSSEKPAIGKKADTLSKLAEVVKKSLGGGSKTTTSAPSDKHASSTAKPSSSTTSTAKPELEAKAAQLEAKLREERDMMMKLLRKNQDELEALKAMQALSAQRQKTIANHDHSDERVHLAEHNRQMSIDPVGHMIKHQQYEVSKKLSG